jgi:hypothetical protein
MIFAEIPRNPTIVSISFKISIHLFSAHNVYLFLSKIYCFRIATLPVTMFVTAFIRPDKYMLKTENKSTPHV